jgi:ribose/xylose/arabinose/galactoside ABC-type transport system permease subunit
MSFIKRNPKEGVLLIVCVAIFIIMAALSPEKFLTGANFSSMMFQLPEFGVMAMGMMVIILTGGINLSLTYVASLSGITMALIISNCYAAGMGGALCVFLGLLGGFAMVMGCGLLNGFLVAKLHVSPILATLGTMMLFEGIGLNLTEGRAISGFPDGFSTLGNGALVTVQGLQIPISLVIFIAVAVLAYILFERTPWGVKLHMVGSNDVAVNYSGVNVWKQLMQAYLASALFCFVAVVIMTSRYNSMKVDYGSSYMMQAILATVMGGTSINGGYGKVGGTVLAIVAIQLLSSGLNIFGLNRFFVDMVMGVILIAVLALNYVYDMAQQRNLLRKIRANEAV